MGAGTRESPHDGKFSAQALSRVTGALAVSFFVFKSAARTGSDLALH